MYIDEMNHIKVKLMVAAMESILTVEQSARILTASKWGGFDAAMTSLARVSDQIASEKAKAGIEAARLEGRIISLKSQVESEKGRADRAMAAIDTLPQRLTESHLTADEEKLLAGVRHWGYLIVYSTELPRNEMVNRLEAQGRVLVDRSEGTYLTVTLPVPKEGQGHVRRLGRA